MAFQKTVNRQYTQGWIGEILNDGPIRAKPARIADGGAGTINRIGRAFDIAGDVPPGKPSGSGISPVDSKTVSFIEQTVKVGGAGFFGILGIPKHYALYGTSTPVSGEQPGPLAPSIDLPDDVEGEFLDMAIMCVALANGGAADGPIPYNSKIYYAIGTSGGTGCITPTAADLGRLFAFPAGVTPSADFELIPNTKLSVSITGNWVSNADQPVRIQMTN